MKLKKYFVIVLAILTAINFSFSSISASAQSIQAKNEVEQMVVEQMSQFEEMTRKKEVNKWKKRARKSILKEKVKIYNTEMDYDQAQVYTQKSTGYHSVVIPIDSPDYHELSNVVVHFSNPGTVYGYSELQVKRSEADTFQVIAYFDGEEASNTVIDETFMTAEEYHQAKAEQEEEQSGAISTQGLDRDGFFDCLGVPALVGWQVGNICGWACATAVLCVPCMAGAFGFAIGSVSTCVYKHWE